MSRDENQIAIFDSYFRPLQIIVEMNRLVVLVDPEESDVEVIARVGEIVGIAAKKCRGKFRRKHQAHIGVLLVFVEVVYRARVQCDHVAAQARRRGTVFFDGAHSGTLCLSGVGGRHGSGDSVLYFRGDIVDTNQHVQFKIGTLGFVRLSLGIESQSSYNPRRR